MSNLPKIQDLVKDVNEAFKTDQFKLLVNQNPPEAWLQVNKYANNSIYLPIDKVEYLLDKIIQEWKVEILECKQMFNAVMTTVRVHYKNPVSGEWLFHDGVGCSELQTKKDTGNLTPDFANINKGAVEMAAPISKTMAIKDACDHIGRIFGRDLNRKNIIAFQQSYSQPLLKEQLTGEDIKEQIKDIKTKSDLHFIWQKLSVDDQMIFLNLFEDKQKQIEDGF